MAVEFQIILPGCRKATLRVPSDLTLEDMEQIKKWIQFSEHNLLADKEDTHA